ncbi:MAG TPA: methionyl-tRNA formyltransferase [Terriglobia bacterium]|nr:methionyl-tRNA formyltransferase [Terriglobia bacterium]
MNLIFCGTPQFAVPTLEKLLAENFSISLVVTNPDEPRGRGFELKAPPVKEFALRAGLKVFQPRRLKDSEAQTEISAIQPDAIVVVAYGHLIPPWMIDLPPLGCINLHASLLPRYRGAAPIAWAIIRGEHVTGVTTMKIDQGLDTGDILLQQQVEISEQDTTETLSGRLSAEGAPIMAETLARLGRGEISPRRQDDQLATIAPMLKKEDGLIDWRMTAQEIANRVRGLRPWPVAHSLFRRKTLQVWAAQPLESRLGPGFVPGDLQAAGGNLLIACGGGTALQLIEVQLEGRKRISGRDFANGVRLQPGERLGSE